MFGTKQFTVKKQAVMHGGVEMNMSTANGKL